MYDGLKLIVLICSSADRNFALAHFMKENRCFPEGTDVKRVMDLYLQVFEQYCKDII